MKFHQFLVEMLVYAPKNDENKELQEEVFMYVWRYEIVAQNAAETVNMQGNLNRKIEHGTIMRCVTVRDSGAKLSAVSVTVSNS